MKNRNLIKKKYLSKIKELKEHNQHYYEKSSPKISDSEYDKLKKEIVDFEKKYNFLKSKSSPSLLVGARPSKNFFKSKHRTKMLSLSNAFGLEDLKNFCKHHDLKLASIEDLIRWRVHKDPIVKKTFTEKLSTDFAGDFDFFCYSNEIDETEHFAIVKGEIKEDENTLVRVQKINYVSDLFDGKLINKSVSSCSIKKAMVEINSNKKGVLVIIKDNKSQFSSQIHEEKKSSQFREYGVGAQILRDLGVRKMLLLTNSKQEIIGLEGFDLKVIGKKSI